MEAGFATAEGQAFGRYIFYPDERKDRTMLTRERMQQMSEPRERTVEVPVLGETIRIKLFRKGDIDAMRAEAVVNGEVDQTKLERLLFMRGLIEPAVDDAGYEEISNGNAVVYYSILNAVMEGNGLTALAQRDARRTFSA